MSETFLIFNLSPTLIYECISLSNPPPSAHFSSKVRGGYLGPFTFPLGSFGSASPIRKLRGGYLVTSTDINAYGGDLGKNEGFGPNEGGVYLAPLHFL